MMKNKYAKLMGLVVIIGVIWYVLPIIVFGITPWKAVFLDNGQVYFGKMISIPFMPNIEMNSVYYINTKGSQAQDILLARLTDDVHGPKDELSINKRHILYIETLRSDSSLVKAIREKFKNK